MHLIISFFLLSAQPNPSDVFIQELFQNTYGFNVLLIMNIWRGLVILAVGLVSFGFCPLFGSQGIFGHQSHKDWHLQSKCLEDHTFPVLKVWGKNSTLSQLPECAEFLSSDFTYWVVVKKCWYFYFLHSILENLSSNLSLQIIESLLFWIYLRGYSIFT